MKSITLVSVLSILISTIAASAFACTIFSASFDGTFLFGGNEDQSPNSSYLVTDKTGRLDVIYFATPWKEEPLVMQTGINEAGLCYDANWIPMETLTPHPERTAQDEWVITRLMREVSTVEQVLSRIFNYNWGNAISYQVHFADKTGDAVVIHPGKDGELTFTRKPRGNGHLVSANFNLAQFDKSSFSWSRFETANKMLSEIRSKNDLTVDLMTSVLKATQRQYGRMKTLYSVVYDLNGMKIYLYYERNFSQPTVLDVHAHLAKTVGSGKINLNELLKNP